MLKFHPITAFMKTYTNFKTKFLIRVFWLKYIFRIKFKISILDFMLLPKTVFHLKGYRPVAYGTLPKYKGGLSEIELSAIIF